MLFLVPSLMSVRANLDLAAMILNLAHCRSASPGGRTTRTYVLFVRREMMRLNRGALMTSSEKGFDMEEAPV